MISKTGSILLVFSLTLGAARAQETVRNLNGPGRFTKFLSSGQLDRWVFEGEAGETIIAHVASQEFDPVLELVRAPADGEVQVLLEKDDPGSESRFSRRLPAAGRYQIRVHAFKFQGGGNYALQVDRFRAQPLVVGEPQTATLDARGQGHYRFAGTQDEILVPELKGAAAGSWKLLDPDGRELSSWMGAVLIARNGECTLVVSGKPHHSYELRVRRARQRSFEPGEEMSGRLRAGEMEVLSFPGHPGDFRLVEVRKQGELASRLVAAPLEAGADRRIARPDEPPPITFLPVASRAGHVRYAAVLGRSDRYQLQLLARTVVSYRVTSRDPAAPLTWGGRVAERLPVGGAVFHRFTAQTGQLCRAVLGSESFVPVLRLYDRWGRPVAQGAEAGDRLQTTLTHMMLTAGDYLLQTSSLGDGGGGKFHLAFDEVAVKTVSLGGREKGVLQPGAREFWAFTGDQGQTVFVNARSDRFIPSVTVHDPTGVELVSHRRGEGTTGSLFALKLPRDGRYILSISAQRGAGNYVLRLIDGD